MRLISYIWLVGAVLPVLLPVSACAHGDLHERIQTLTAQIARTPTNAALYFDRAECHRLHQDWTNALADYDRVEKLDPGNVRLSYCRGRMWQEADEPGRALPLLDRHLLSVTNDPTAFATRARVRVSLSQWRAAADDFSKAIALAPTGRPEFYIERAAALAALGAKEEGVRGLNDGIARMGPLVTLELAAIDLDTSLRRFDSALARIDAVMASLQRRESWLVRRAEVLKLAGREADACKAYRDALSAIERLPAAHRYTRATASLEATIRSALQDSTTPTTK